MIAGLAVAIVALCVVCALLVLECLDYSARIARLELRDELSRLTNSIPELVRTGGGQFKQGAGEKQRKPE